MPDHVGHGPAAVTMATSTNRQLGGTIPPRPTWRETPAHGGQGRVSTERALLVLHFLRGSSQLVTWPSRRPTVLRSAGM